MCFQSPCALQVAQAAQGDSCVKMKFGHQVKARQILQESLELHASMVSQSPSAMQVIGGVTLNS